MEAPHVHKQKGAGACLEESFVHSKNHGGSHIVAFLGGGEGWFQSEARKNFSASCKFLHRLVWSSLVPELGNSAVLG